MLITREEKVFSRKSLTSTDTVLSEFLVDCSMVNRISITVRNDMNQKVDVRVVGNDSLQPANSVPLGKADTCDANSKTIINVQSHVWTKYMGVDVKPQVAPTTGSIDVSMFLQEDK